MALLIEQVSRGLGTQRTPVGPGLTRVVVRPGDAFRFVDDAGQPAVRFPRLRVRRLGNDLLVDGLPEDRVIELDNFYGACRPGLECSVSLEGLGVPRTVLTEATAPKAALADGSFLVYSDDSDLALAAALPAARLATAGSGASTAAIVGGGALVVGGIAAAGGGGGGDDPPATPRDVTPPPVPTIAALPGDGAVNAAERAAGVAFRGTAEPGSTVVVTWGASSVTTTAGPDGTFVASFAPEQVPPDGATAVRAVATDAAGNASPEGSRAVVVDTTPPAAPAVTSGALTNAIRPVLSGTAEPGTTVVVSIDANGDGSVEARWTVTASTAGNWSVDTSAVAPDGASGVFAGLANGSSNSVRVQATDAAGNVGPQASSALAVDTSVPPAPVINAVAGDNFVNLAESAGAVTITGTVPVAFANRTVRVVWGNVPLDASFTNPAGTAWSATFASGQVPIDGATTVSASYTSVAGTPSLNASLQVIVDRVPPGPLVAPTLDPGSDSGVVGDGTTNVTTPTFDVGAQPAGTTAQLRVDGNVVASTFVAALGTLVPNAPVAAGARSITYVLTDAAGNASAVSPPLALTIDTSAPSVATPTLAPGSDSGVTGDNVTSDATPTLLVGAQSPGTVAQLFVGGSAVASTFVAASGELTPTSPIADGAIVFTYRLTDPAGNVSPTSPGRTVTIDTVAPVAAAPTLAPASDTGVVGDGITSDTTPTLLVGAQPAGSGAQLFVDGVPVAASFVAGAGTLTPNAPIADGARVFTYVLTDPAGNVSTASPATPVTIDTTAPATPASAPDLVAASDTGAFSNDEVTNDTTPTFAIGALPAGATAQLLVDGNTVTSTYDAGTGTITSTAVLAAGSRSITYVLVNAIGNPSAPSPALAITIDTTAPTVPTRTDNITSANAVGPVTFTFTASEPVFGFTASDVTISGGAAGAFTGADDSTTFTIVGLPNDPGAGQVSNVTAQIASGSFTDRAGNVVGAVPSVSQAFDLRTGISAADVLDNFGAPGTVANGGTTDDRQPTLRLTLGRPLTAGQRLEFFVDGVATPVQSFITTQAQYTYELTAGQTLAPGTYTFNAALTDTSAPSGTTPVVNRLFLDLDSVAPGVNGYTFTVT